MPSKDTFHERHPETNKHLEPDSPEVSVQARRPATERRAMSGQVQRLARRLRIDPDKLAGKISSDTLRRTKYPVRERVTEDGKRVFEDDLGVVEGPRSLIHK